MKSRPSLVALLRKGDFMKSSEGKASGDKNDARLQKLQLKMLRIQQGVWSQKKRVIIVFEGFDAAGKGGAIRRLIEDLDPRGYQVFAVGPPTKDEQGRHYLFRFWQMLPPPGTLTILDRSWYGRVLVEKVSKLAPKERIAAAYSEICELEKMLMADGVEIIKIFLAIDKDEQLRRFEQRLADPYKQWKLTEADVESRSQWGQYVVAVEEIFKKTHTRQSPWHLVAANDKHYARKQVLTIVTEQLQTHGRWIESKAQAKHVRSLESALHELGLKEKSLR